MRKVLLPISICIVIAMIITCGSRSLAKSSSYAASSKASKENPDLISGIRIMHKDNNYFGEDYSSLKIAHDYEQISLSKETQKAYPELYKKIMVVNDLIGTDEANSYYAAYRQVVKNEKNTTYDHPYLDEDWKIYVRRADSDVVSILVKITTASYEDYNNDRFMTFNINPKTGEDILLSDIIKDDDAFFDVLVQKFMEIMKADYEGFFAGGNSMSESQLMKTLETCLNSEQLLWTLDSQGVSFWLNSRNLSPVSMNCKILFCEDTKGKLFADDVRKKIPDTWVMALYPNTYEPIDSDDDGKADNIYVMEKLEYYEESDYESITGILVDYNGKEYEFPLDGDDYDFSFSLIHQNGKSVLLSNYKEYDYSLLELYKLDDKGVKKADLLCAYFCGDSDEVFDDFDNYNYVTPIMTDPTCFNIAVNTWLLSTADAVMEYRITDAGKFKRLSKVGAIFEKDRYVITLKTPLEKLQIVDTKTFETTKETCDLKAGEKLKLMYTDGETYVDCITRYNRLVRIKVVDDEELGRCIKVKGKNVNIQEVFDGMVYAG
ncbi:hypothetical protein [Butyrivibrio sp. VCD2006]|uniref:hypothetical protein n=1 Tax=Butyrivibrio sp. VCD2006 TaxID=1280664 RepID=UPI0003F4FBD5|nr:hypothetical protein [Butyrivibrio sp. VCD2006]